MMIAIRRKGKTMRMMIRKVIFMIRAIVYHSGIIA
jgi:hypothetical protein